MIKIIKPNRYKTGLMHCRKEVFLLDGVEDLALLPKDTPAGSVAYTADMSAHFRLSPSGVWEEYEEEIDIISDDVSEIKETKIKLME